MRDLEPALGRVDVDDGVAKEDEVEVDDARAVAERLGPADRRLDVLEVRQELGRR